MLRYYESGLLLITYHDRHAVNFFFIPQMKSKMSEPSF